MTTSIFKGFQSLGLNDMDFTDVGSPQSTTLKNFPKCFWKFPKLFKITVQLFASFLPCTMVFNLLRTTAST